VGMADVARQAVQGFAENVLEEVRTNPAKAVERALDLLKKAKKK